MLKIPSYVNFPNVYVPLSLAVFAWSFLYYKDKKNTSTFRSHIFVKIWIVNSATGTRFETPGDTPAPRLFWERIWSRVRGDLAIKKLTGFKVETTHMRSFLDLRKIPKLKSKAYKVMPLSILRTALTSLAIFSFDYLRCQLCLNI